MAEDLYEAVRQFLSKDGQPRTARAIHQGARLRRRASVEDLEELLDQWVASGRLYRFPPYRSRSPRYGVRSPVEIAEGLVPQLCRNPLTERALRQKLAKQVGVIDQSEWRRLLDDLVRRKIIYRHPPTPRGRTERFATSPPDISKYLADYLNRLVKQMHALVGAGVGPDECMAFVLNRLRAELGVVEAKPIDVHPRTTTTDVRDVVFQAIRRVAPDAEKGALVPMRSIRRELQSQGVNWSDAQRTILQLARERKVFLHRHDFPASLSAEQRRELLEDEHGNVYVGLVLMRH